MSKLFRILFVYFAIFLTKSSFSQKWIYPVATDPVWAVNLANQTGLSCNCFELKANAAGTTGQSGGVFYNAPVDLTKSFDYSFDVYLGLDAEWSADGMVFVLHDDPNSLGQCGGSLGFVNLVPSVGIQLDIFQELANENDPDPFYDHIAIFKNGSLKHGSTDELASVQQLMPGGASVALPYGQYHKLRVVWDAGSTTYSAYFNGVLKVSYTGDIVNNIFGGNSVVYWGFVAGSGGINGRFEFCFDPGSVEADITAKKYMCDGDTTRFDFTADPGFFGIDSVLWNFGDGYGDTTLLPTEHVYDMGGVYDVTMTAIDSGGCRYTDVEPAYMHSFMLNATVSDDSICAGTTVNFNTALTPGIAPPCDYSLELNDALNANWAGAYVNVYKNGDSTAYDTPGIYALTFNNGDVVDLEYVSDGSSDFSNTIYFDDNNGNNLYQDGVLIDFNPPDQGIVYTTTITCPANNAGYTYNWQPSSQFTDNSLVNQSIVPDSTIDYSLTVTDNITGCLLYDSLPVFVEPDYSLGIGRDTVLCVNNDPFIKEVLISGPFDTVGVWTDAGMNIVPSTFNPVTDADGVFTYTIDQKFCPDEVANITITIQGSKSAGVSTETDHCITDGSVDMFAVLGGTPDVGGSWTDALGDPITNVYNLSVAPYYVATYTVFDAICGDISSNVTVSVESLPDAGTGRDSALCSSADSMKYEVLLSGDYSTTGVWLNQSNDTLRDYIDPAIDTAGVFTYSVTGNLCPGASSTSITIAIETEPNSGISADTIVCSYYNTFDMFDVLKGNPDAVGSWYDALDQSVSSTFDPASDNAGTYTYQIDNVVCGTYTSIVIVRVSYIENSSWLASSATCNGFADGNIIFSASNGISPYSYLWSNGATTSDLSGLSQGNYTVSITDSIGCVNSQIIGVTQPDTLDYNETINNSHCDFQCDGRISLNISGGTTPYTYSWSSESVNDSIIKMLCAGKYDVTITDANGCVAVVDTITLLSQDSLVANFTYETSSNNALEVMFVDSSLGNPVSFDWDFDDGSTAMEDSLSYEYSDAGTYEVLLVVEDIYGCLDTITKSITVINPVSSLVIPTAISPDGDGYNDTWKINNISYFTTRKVSIYNRWGSLVYQSDDYQNDWNGIYNGEPLPEGVYYFVLDLGLEENYNGSIDIIK